MRYIKKTSEFFHRMGIVFSVFFFIAFLMVISDDSDDFLPGLMIAALGTLCIYGFSRIIGWMINGLVKG